MIAKSLIVYGSSRFLNTIYANNLSISGITSFASLDTTTLNVSGASTLAGTTVTGTLRVVNTSGANSDSAAMVWGSSGTGGKRIRASSDCIQTVDGSAYSNLYLNYYGGAVYLSTANDATKRIYADNGTFTTPTLVATDLMVTNELRAFKWNIQHIANLGGTFLVTPTLKCTANSATFTVISISGTTITATINDATAITGVSLGGGDWNNASKIKISGKIGGIVIGTCDGTLTSNMNATAGTLTFTFTYPNQSINELSVKTYAASEVSDLTVMLTEVNHENVLKPIGIYMTSYDSNKYSHISLYGGTSAKPTVRIGNLQGLDAINGVSPDGWGIYTDNGFFSGVIVSTSGKIGNFTISTALYSDNHSAWNTNLDGIYIGSDYISFGKQGVTYFKPDGTGKIGAWTVSATAFYNGKSSYSETTNDGVWLGTDGIGLGKGKFYVTNAGALTATSATITGVINATSGVIGSNATNKITIGTNTTNASIYSGMSTLANTSSNGFYIGTDGIALGKGAFKVTSAGVLTATSATITGGINATSGTIGSNATVANRWQIGDTAIYKGKTSYSETTNDGVWIGTDGIGLGKGKFYVTSAGALTSTSGTIGGWTIGTNALSIGTYGSDNSTFISNTNMSSKAIAGRTGADWRFTIGSHFGVTNTGAVYANSATLTGAINASSGTIGSNATNKITIGTNTTNASIYSGMSSLSNTSNDGFYIGTDGIALGKGAFKVTNAGVLTATSATITGVINASSGTLGNGGIIMSSNGIELDGTTYAQLYSFADSTESGYSSNAHSMFLNSYSLKFDDILAHTDIDTFGVNTRKYVDNGTNTINTGRSMNSSGIWSGGKISTEATYTTFAQFSRYTSSSQVFSAYDFVMGFDYGYPDNEFYMGNMGTGARLSIYAPIEARYSMEIYNSSGTSPYIDFHRTGSSNADYDSRVWNNDADQVEILHSDGSKTQFKNGNIEIYSSTGLIDFHYNKGIDASTGNEYTNTTDKDYTSRIRETSKGTLKSYPGAITSGSDGALKKDIIPINTSYINLVDKLRPVEFRYKDAPDFKHLGFIAQDIEQALNEIGIEDKPLIIPPADEDDYYALDYTQIIPIIVAYVKYLRNEINELKGE